MKKALTWNFEEGSQCDHFHRLVIDIVDANPEITIYKGDCYVTIIGPKDKLQTLYDQLPPIK